ncbi:hypothetical protein BC629DRAFT_1443098 [Irpex lacteus]|nr:hypothetical protein BC629DRAFT_1443098 [Irpex lacteus]
MSRSVSVGHSFHPSSSSTSTTIDKNDEDGRKDVSGRVLFLICKMDVDCRTNTVNLIVKDSTMIMVVKSEALTESERNQQTTVIIAINIITNCEISKLTQTNDRRVHKQKITDRASNPAVCQDLPGNCTRRTGSLEGNPCFSVFDSIRRQRTWVMSAALDTPLSRSPLVNILEALFPLRAHPHRFSTLVASLCVAPTTSFPVVHSDLWLA